MIFTTRNSTYEVDQANKQVRRLNGKKDPTPRTGLDGEWRQYSDISKPIVGHSVWILWTAATPLLEGSDPKDLPMTITSPITEIFTEGSMPS